jgi:acyl-homoserine-lactone acylase
MDTAHSRFQKTYRVVVATIAMALVLSTAYATMPRPQLADQVEIRRTEYGVPHIKGETLEAVAFGLAWCQAEDHVVTIMEHMLRARGELALHEGKKELNSDFKNRQYRVRARAIETYHKLSPDFRSMVEGYAAGFSYYVDQHRAELPDWVQPITPHDVASHGLTGIARFAFDRGGIVSKTIKNLEAGDQVAMAFDDREGMTGSNMWAFSPNRTKSGNAILMGNPHQAWSKVATYYEAHLTVPGKLNFYGSTFIGRPVLTTGFNEHLGWSHTVNYPDLEEIYELTLDPSRPDHYLFDGGSVPMHSEDVTIEYRTDEGTAEETRTYWHSPLGPIIHRTDTHAYVLKSVAYDEFRFYEQWLHLAQCKSYEEFQSVLDVQAIPMFNIAYADREGNIYFLWNGSIPDIPHENKRAEAVPASSSTDVWTRVHATDELPQLLNPKGGYVQNSNSPPYFTNLHEPLARESYPDHFPNNALGLRTQHSLEIVHNKKKFSLEDVRDLKYSPRMLLADRVKDDLIKAVKKAKPDAETSDAIDILHKWDNTTKAESRGSVLFKSWWSKYSGGNDNIFATPWSEKKPMSTPHGIGDTERAVTAFADAIEDTKEKYGDIAVAWGDVHRVRRGNVDLPVSGGGGRTGNFRALGFRQADDGKQIVSGGDSWIFAVEFGENLRAYSVVGYSQTSNEDSPHYNDQTVLYANDQMKRVAFTEAEIADQLLSSYRPGN